MLVWTCIVFERWERSGSAEKSSDSSSAPMFLAGSDGPGETPPPKTSQRSRLFVGHQQTMIILRNMNIYIYIHMLSIFTYVHTGNSHRFHMIRQSHWWKIIVFTDTVDTRDILTRRQGPSEIVIVAVGAGYVNMLGFFPGVSRRQVVAV